MRIEKKNIPKIGLYVLLVLSIFSLFNLYSNLSKLEDNKILLENELLTDSKYRSINRNINPNGSKNTVLGNNTVSCGSNLFTYPNLETPNSPSTSTYENTILNSYTSEYNTSWWPSGGGGNSHFPYSGEYLNQWVSNLGDPQPEKIVNGNCYNGTKCILANIVNGKKIWSITKDVNPNKNYRISFNTALANNPSSNRNRNISIKTSASNQLLGNKLYTSPSGIWEPYDQIFNSGCSENLEIAIIGSTEIQNSIIAIDNISITELDCGTAGFACSNTCNYGEIADTGIIPLVVGEIYENTTPPKVRNRSDLDVTSHSNGAYLFMPNASRTEDIIGFYFEAHDKETRWKLQWEIEYEDGTKVVTADINGNPDLFHRAGCWVNGNYIDVCSSEKFPTYWNQTDLGSYEQHFILTKACSKKIKSVLVKFNGDGSKDCDELGQNCTKTDYHFRKVRWIVNQNPTCSCTNPTNGTCGVTLNTCNSGTLEDISDNDSTRPAKYLWNCKGVNGGTTSNCSVDKGQCSGFNIYDGTNTYDTSKACNNTICGSSDTAKPTRNLTDTVTVRVAANGSIIRTLICWSAADMPLANYLNSASWKCSPEIIPVNGGFITNTLNGFIDQIPSTDVQNTARSNGLVFVTNIYDTLGGFCSTSPGYTGSKTFFHPGATRPADGQAITPRTENHVCGSTDTNTCIRKIGVTVNGKCGDAAKTYFSSENKYTGLYCSSGILNPLFPTFPLPGEKFTWTCQGIGTGSTSETCTAEVESDEDVSCQTTENTLLLEGTIRDFNDTHSDFESSISGFKTGIVNNTLDKDGKPEYSGIFTNNSIASVDSFKQWYRDVNGVNLSAPFTIKLERIGNSTIFRYTNNSFFPIDNQLLGNQGRNHNFHFTLETQTSFLYQGGETFSFTGDDDIWLFIDGKLAMDLGGTHSPLSSTVKLDTLGLTKGKIYNLNFFFAERHTTGSNFSIETDIKMADPVCINVDCTADPTHPSCNLCLNPGQGNINQDSTLCKNPTKPKIKLTDENSIGDKATGIDASQNLKLDWTDSLPTNSNQCFATYNFELKKADNDTVVISQDKLSTSEFTIPSSNLEYGTNYKWKVTAKAAQSENKNITISSSDLTAADCNQNSPFSVTKTINIPANSRINSGTITIPSSNAISSISVNGTTYNAPINNQDILNKIKEGINTIVINFKTSASCGT